MVAQGKQKTTKMQLCRIQRMACLAITGAMKLTPTVAMEVLLNLALLDLLIMAEVRLALHRLHVPKQPSHLKTEVGMLSIWKNVGNPILDMWSDHTIPIYYYSKAFKVIIDQDQWRTQRSKVS
jgi:hypothetical protein